MAYTCSALKRTEVHTVKACSKPPDSQSNTLLLHTYIQRGFSGTPREISVLNWDVSKMDWEASNHTRDFSKVEFAMGKKKLLWILPNNFDFLLRSRGVGSLSHQLNDSLKFQDPFGVYRWNFTQHTSTGSPLMWISKAVSSPWGGHFEHFFSLHLHAMDKRGYF